MKDLIAALTKIRTMAMDHPCFDQEKFEQRDIEGLAEEGGTFMIGLCWVLSPMMR